MQTLPKSTQMVEMTSHLIPGSIKLAIDWDQIDGLLVSGLLSTLRELRLHVYVSDEALDASEFWPRRIMRDPFRCG